MRSDRNWEKVPAANRISGMSISKCLSLYAQTFFNWRKESVPNAARQKSEISRM